MVTNNQNMVDWEHKCTECGKIDPDTVKKYYSTVLIQKAHHMFFFKLCKECYRLNHCDAIDLSFAPTKYQRFSTVTK